MAQTLFTDLVTLIAAAWLNDVDANTYSVLSAVAGTNTITATGPTTVTAYAAKQRFFLTPAATNTGATTLNISSIGARNIFSDGAACVGGELKAGVPVELIDDGTQLNILGRRFFKQPTLQTFLTGSGTYTTPAGATRIKIRMVGAGAGGAGSGSAPGAATDGADTTFSTLTAAKGLKAVTSTAGAGGVASGGDVNIDGQAGSSTGGATNQAGGNGGGTPFGQGAFGGGAATGTTPSIPAPNTGAGGAGAGSAGTAGSGAGAGSGATLEKTIVAPAATYSYAVGAKGTGGTAGASGSAGSDGSAGRIIVEESYN